MFRDKSGSGGYGGYGRYDGLVTGRYDARGGGYDTHRSGGYNARGGGYDGLATGRYLLWAKRNISILVRRVDTIVLKHQELIKL